MTQYRVRLKTGRVIGPLSLEDLEKLKDTRKITGKEEIQEFPVGDWGPITNVLNFDGQASSSNEVKEETFLIKLKEIKESSNEKEKKKNFQEFEFKMEDPFQDEVFAEETIIQAENTEEKNEVEEVKQEKIAEESAEETSLEEIELDKTQINPDYQAYLKALKEEEEKKKAAAEEAKRKREEEIEIEEHKPDMENDATEMISLDDLKDELKAAKKEEKRLLTEKKKKDVAAKKAKKKKVEKSNSDDDYEDEYEDEDEVSAKKKRGSLILTILIFIGASIIFLSPDEKPKKQLKPIKVIEPKITFPTPFNTAEEKTAKDAYIAALKEIEKGHYKSNLEAIKLLKKSVVNKFNDNPAIGLLIHMYSEVLINSNKKNQDATTIFKLVQLFKAKSVTDVNFANGIANFYSSIDKTNAAIRIVEEYRSIPNNKPSLLLFTTYLKILTKAGSLEKASKLAERLQKEKNKNFPTLVSLYEYYKTIGEEEKSISILKEALKLYPKSSYFLIEQGFVLFKNQEFESIKPLIWKLNGLEVENSKLYYSRYLTLKGMYHAYKKQVKKATKEFEKSLKLYESYELIELLASLEDSEDEQTSNLIKTSQATKLLRSSIEAQKSGDLIKAFSFAIKASDIAPELDQVQLQLAKLQMERGYLDRAIITLEELYKKSSSSLNILFTLIDAYTEAYKFKKVDNLLITAAQRMEIDDARYATAKSKYFLYKGEFNLSSAWLIRAINTNPLDDKNNHDLAKIYIKHHRYNKAKVRLNRAMDLDPSKVEYRLTFAKILYEVETSKEAIGYLYRALEDFPDNPKLLSAIGIYFYRSGQIKNYENIREKLLALPEKDESLYEFLIESARLDDNFKGIVENSNALLEVNPGNLKVRMELAELHISLAQYKEAKAQLDAVESRLETYPRLQYLKARLFFLIDQLEKAEALANKEIRENPTFVDGYNLLGDIFYKRKKCIEARTYYVKASQVNPKSLDAILGIAKCAFSTSQFDLALDQFEKAVKLAPNKCDTWRQLGNAYRKVGQSRLAIEKYKHFLELCPDSRYKNKINTYIRDMN